MKLKLPLIAAFFTIASLTACGSDPKPAVPVFSPASLVKTDITIGTGAEAVAGNRVTVHYTGWLYVETAPHKGAQFDTSAVRGPYQVTLGTGGVIQGFDQGITGMRVGGKRTVLIPASLAYGASGYGGVPPNSGVVFDIELLSVQ